MAQRNSSTSPFHSSDEAFNLSDMAVIGTLLAVGVLLIIAIGIATWQCIKKKHPLSRTPFLLRVKLRRLSRQQSKMSQEQFYRLLEIYHRSGGDTQEPRKCKKFQAHGGSHAKTHPRQGDWCLKTQHRDLELAPKVTRRGETAGLISKHATRKPFQVGSPLSSDFSTPECFRQESASTSGSRPGVYPVSIISTTLLDLSSPTKTTLVNLTSPQKSSFEEGTMSTSYGEYHLPEGSFTQYNIKSPSYADTKRMTPSTSSHIDLRSLNTHISMECRSAQLHDSALISPLKSPCMDTSSPEQKMFYFAWPEAEEEAQGSVFSPLLLKASMDSGKDAVSIGDEKVLLAQQARACLSELKRHGTVSPPGCSPISKGVVKYKRELLPYGIKSTWV